MLDEQYLSYLSTVAQEKLDEHYLCCIVKTSKLGLIHRYHQPNKPIVLFTHQCPGETGSL